MGFSVPLSSVRLLVPPLRLVSAYMWRVVEQQNLKHYDKVEENILLITKLLPGILSERQRTALIIGLRAKMILELCKDELPTDLQSVKAHLRTVEASNISMTSGSEVEALQSKLLHLVISLLEDPDKKKHFFREVFPLEYGPEFDKALQALVGHFLSRLEKLLLVPDFKQAALWLDTESTGWDDLLHVNWDPKHLLPLLQSDYLGTLETNDLPSVVEDRIISSLSLAPLSGLVVSSEGETVEHSFVIESFSQNNQHENEERDIDVPMVHVFTTNQDVNEEIETVHQLVPLNQLEDHLETEVVEELDLPTCDTCEVGEHDLNNKNTMESPLCEAGVQTMTASRSESERETRTEVETSEPIPKVADANMSNGSEEGSEVDNETDTAESTGKTLKVIVPKHLVPVVKQISLPSVLLSRCTSSKPVPLKIVPASNPSSSSFKSSVSERIRTLHQRNVRTHKQRHSGTGNYKCVSCNMSFNTHFQASVHRRKRHTSLIYSCPKCEKTFKSMKAWTRHRAEHKEEKPQQCTDCGEQFPSLQALVAHSKTHSHVVSEILLSPEKAARPAKRRPGECRFCGEIFTPIELRTHLKTHPEFRPHQCDHCGRCFANLSNLLAHISNHTGEKPHNCSNCGKKFFSKSLLKSHMKTHSMERSYCCSYCGKCFQNTGNLNIHMRIHTGEKPYTCLQCGKAFSSTGRLQVHQRCHTGEKPYQCNVCGRGFVVSSHRTIHMRSHTGVRPFTCEICGKTFARRNCWNEHRYSHTDVKPFPCLVCSKSFVRRSHLKRHMQSHNDDQSIAVQNDI